MPCARELPLDDHLRGDAGVVGARLPEDVVAAHAVQADEQVLDVPLSAWPMCSEPVTFGGGTVMQYGSPGASGSASKAPEVSQASRIRCSTGPAS